LWVNADEFEEPFGHDVLAIQKIQGRACCAYFGSDTDKAALCQAKTAQLGIYNYLLFLVSLRHSENLRDKVNGSAAILVYLVTYLVNVTLAGFAREAMP